MKTLHSEDLTMIKESISSAIATTSATVGASSGVLAFINKNSGAFSLMIGLTTLVITIIFSYLAWRSRVRTEEVKKMTYELELKKFMVEQEEKLEAKRLEIEKQSKPTEE